MMIPNELEIWWKDRPFDALSAEQQKRVETYMSAKEYNSYHQMAVFAHTATLEMPVVSKRVEDTVIHAFRNRPTKHSAIRQKLITLGNYQLPLWQVAATIVGLLFFILPLKEDIQQPSASNTEEQFSTFILADTMFGTPYDTVYKSPAPATNKTWDTIPEDAKMLADSNSIGDVQIIDFVKEERSLLAYNDDSFKYLEPKSDDKEIVINVEQLPLYYHERDQSEQDYLIS